MKWQQFVAMASADTWAYKGQDAVKYDATAGVVLKELQTCKFENVRLCTGIAELQIPPPSKKP